MSNKFNCKEVQNELKCMCKNEFLDTIDNANLTDLQETILILFIKGCTLEEIAYKLGYSASTIKSKKLQALKKIYSLKNN